MIQFEELMLSLQALKPEIDDLSDALGMKAIVFDNRVTARGGMTLNEEENPEYSWWSFRMTDFPSNLAVSL